MQKMTLGSLFDGIGGDDRKGVENNAGSIL